MASMGITVTAGGIPAVVTKTMATMGIKITTTGGQYRRTARRLTEFHSL